MFIFKKNCLKLKDQDDHQVDPIEVTDQSVKISGGGVLPISSTQFPFQPSALILDSYSLEDAVDV